MNSESPQYLHVKVTINGNELYTCGFEEAEVLIGRGSDCHVLLENAGVSRNHAKLLRNHGEIKVIDLESGNGTFVNGKQVTEAVLTSGDTLRIGKFSLYVTPSMKALATAPPQPSAFSGEASSGTVFLRPEERAKILQQSTAAKPQDRITVPTTTKNKSDWPSAMLFFALGTLFGLLCSWIFTG